MIHVALIEDDPLMVDQIVAALTDAPDIDLVATATNWQAGRALAVRGGFDVLLCDLGLPGGSGIDLIREAAELHEAADILVITIFGEHAKVLDSIRAGARGYLHKADAQADFADAIRMIRAGGSPISPMIARQLLRQLAPADQVDVEDQNALTQRETEVLTLLAKGFSYAETAEVANIAPSTVATHVKRIYRKLHVRSRAEAVFEACQRGYIAPHG